MESRKERVLSLCLLANAQSGKIANNKNVIILLMETKIHIFFEWRNLACCFVRQRTRRGTGVVRQSLFSFGKPALLGNDYLVYVMGLVAFEQVDAPLERW